MEKEIFCQNNSTENRCDICKFLDEKFIDCECKLKTCFTCISKILSYSFFRNISLNINFFEKNPNLPLFCFSCKRETLISLNEMSNISKENERKIQPILCDYCETKGAELLCMDCNEDILKMCEDCLNKTHTKKLKNHNVIKFDQTLLCLCKENNICTKLCQDCSMIICIKCIEKNHKNHILQSMDDIFKEILNKKKEKIISFIENMKNEIFNNSNYESGIQQEGRQMDIIIEKLETHLKILQTALTKIKEKKTQIETIRNFYKTLKDNLNISAFETFPLQLKYFLSQKMEFSKLNLDFQNIEFKPNERKLKQIEEEVKNLSKNITNLTRLFSGFEVKAFKFGVKAYEKEYEFFKKITEISPHLKIKRTLKFKFNQEKVLCVLDIEEANNQKTKCLIFAVDGEEDQKKCSYLEIHKFSTIKKENVINEIKIEKKEKIESHIENVRVINKFENFLYTCAEDIHVYPAINDLNNFNSKKRRVFKHPEINAFVRTVHMFRDRTKESVEKMKSDENIYLLFSLDNTSSVFIMNYKNQTLCKEFINKGKLCTSLDSFYDEKERKLYLILGYQLSNIQVYEFASSSSFNLVAQYSSENFCLNSIKIESYQGIFYLYFGFGNGVKKIGKISKYEFKKQLENEKQPPITQFEIENNQIFATEIIDDYFVAATQEYLYLFNKNRFEEGFTKSRKFKDAKISDVVYIKDKDLGELLSTISFQEKMVKIYKL